MFKDFSDATGTMAWPMSNMKLKGDGTATAFATQGPPKRARRARPILDGSAKTSAPLTPQPMTESAKESAKDSEKLVSVEKGDA